MIFSIVRQATLRKKGKDRMTKKEVVEFTGENTAEGERSYSETSELTGLIQIKHMRNLHPWFFLERYG